jgi:hypothetical protein
MNEINNEILMEITITGNSKAIEKLKELLDDEGAYQSMMNAISEDIKKLIATKVQLKDKELSVLVIEREIRREMRQLEKLAKLYKKL